MVCSSENPSMLDGSQKDLEIVVKEIYYMLQLTDSVS